MAKRICPICTLPDQDVIEGDFGERLQVRCARCGRFSCTETAAADISGSTNRLNVSNWIRSLDESGSPPPALESQDLSQLLASLPTYQVAQKQLLLLSAIERRTDHPGQFVWLDESTDSPLAWASGSDEFLFQLGSLAGRQLIRGKDELSLLPEVQITAAGWDFLDSHRRESSVSDQVFVAMSFARELESAFTDGIKPALSATGFSAQRVDSEPHLDRIDLRIIAKIRQSRFVIADVTGQRPGVYFEAGFALGLDLPVIWTVRADDLANVHFDTRQYNHIVWTAPADLKSQLETFVLAILGRGSRPPRS